LGSVFFFNLASQKIVEWFADLFTGSASGNAQLKRFSWYSLTKNIAKTGVFNGKYQGIRAVEKANVYDVLRYAMVEKLEQEEINKKVK
jgi:hypothetical protein